MKNSNKEFIIEEKKKEQKTTRKGVPTFGSEAMLMMLILLKVLGLISFILAVFYAVEGLHELVNEVQKQEENSAVETYDSAEKTDNSLNDFLTDYYRDYLLSEY